MIYIGTSGYFYKNWVGEFYPADIKTHELFNYYAKHFNSLELNSTFYRFPKITTLKSWKYKLKKINNFKLSIKANRQITHRSKLKNIDELKNFIKICKNLGNSLGVVLFQLPPSLKYDIELLIHFTRAFGKDIKYAIEFRNDSWYRIETYAHLKDKNIALVWHDYNQEINFEKTSDFVYVRLHGSEGKYKGNYSDEFLLNLYNRIKSNESYVYFNNTDDNSAFKDALRLKAISENKF